MNPIDRSLVRNRDLRLRCIVIAIGIAIPLASIAGTRVAAAQDFTGASASPSTSARPSPAFDALQAASAAARGAVERAKPNQQAALRYLAYVALAQRQVLAAIERGGAIDDNDAVAGEHRAASRNRSSGAIAGGSATAANPNDAAATTDNAVNADNAAADAAAALWRVTARVTESLLPAAPIALPADVAPRAAAPNVAATADRIAAGIVERAAGDRFDLTFEGAVPQGRAQWASQLQPARPPHLPRLGEMKTFYLASGSAVRPPAPPALGSAEFQRDLDELQRIATTRTETQVATAKFWEMTTGSLVAGHWQQVALDLARKHRADPRSAVRAASASLLAALDANIACHDAKYTYWVPRPSQVDPTLKPIIALPNHPSYPSNHACDSGAAALVLAQFYPSERDALVAQAIAAGESRLYGSIHYRFDADAGMAIARDVAAAVERAEGMQSSLASGGETNAANEATDTAPGATDAARQRTDAARQETGAAATLSWSRR